MPELQERYRLLVQLGQLVNSTLDLRKVFGRSAREIRKLLGCDRVSLVLVRGDQFQAGYAPPWWLVS
jgi:formate hydrogenlyase transcriptional activator